MTDTPAAKAIKSSMAAKRGAATRRAQKWAAVVFDHERNCETYMGGGVWVTDDNCTHPASLRRSQKCTTSMVNGFVIPSGHDEILICGPCATDRLTITFGYSGATPVTFDGVVKCAMCHELLKGKA